MIIYNNEQLEQYKDFDNKQLTNSGICPTCFRKQLPLNNDLSQFELFKDEQIECLMVSNPRAEGHMIISTTKHYKDLSEAPDLINYKIIFFAKRLMTLISSIYNCEKVYMCTMCDGLMNHYHMQLIPRYKTEKRGASNFVKERKQYVYDEQKFTELKKGLLDISKEFSLNSNTI